MEAERLSVVVQKSYCAACGRDAWPQAMVALSDIFEEVLHDPIFQPFGRTTSPVRQGGASSCDEGTSYDTCEC